MYCFCPPTDYLRRSFCYSGAFLWNNLPITLERPTLLETISKGVSISYTLYRTPTRQTCKTVIVLYYIVYKNLLIYQLNTSILATDVLLPCLNKVVLILLILLLLYYYHKSCQKTGYAQANQAPAPTNFEKADC